MLLEDFDVPKEKYFQSTTDDISDIMEKLQLESSDEEETQEELKQMDQLSEKQKSDRDFAFRRGLSDILKTKLV